MVRDAPRQIPLSLPHVARFGDEDFLVAPPNAEAHALVTGWPRWPDRLLLLVGGPGAGKSHLGAIWARASGATVTLTPDEAIAALRAAGDEPRVLLDGAGGADENALFHALNLARERRAHLLVTARSVPTALWPTLPDLASRLRALPVARLEAPDDATMKAVLVKLIDDRQLVVEADVVEYVARHAERSLGALSDLVDALDRESLARSRPVGRGLAADVLARMRDQED